MSRLAEILKARKAGLAVNLPPVETKQETQRKADAVLDEKDHLSLLREQLKNFKLPLLERIRIRKELEALERLGIPDSGASAIQGTTSAKLVQQENRLPTIIITKEKQPDLPTIEPKPHETFSLNIELNEEQQIAVRLTERGKSFVLTGAAGTGKTTAAREIGKKLLLSKNLGTHNFKVFNHDTQESFYVDGPAIAFCAFTRRATNNIRRALHKDPELEESLRYNVMTIHALLEFVPEIFLTEQGTESMRFVPTRTAFNPLQIRYLVLEESSMVGLTLWAKLRDALPTDCQIIFLGDINQLQPVMDRPVFSYALTQLPVIELHRVYRQALENPILAGAHMILKGQAAEFQALCDDPARTQLRSTYSKGATDVAEPKLAVAMGRTFRDWWKTGKYNPETDMILSPFNKNDLGTINMNNWIAQFLGEERGAAVYEVLAGRNKLYLAEGDKVMFDKQDGVITKISHNARYIGKLSQPAGTDLTRFGMRIVGQKDAVIEGLDDMDDGIVGYENINIDDEPEDEELKKREASHVVEVTFEDDGRKEVLHATGDFDPSCFSLGYCLTVHKAQGCEWEKVFLLMHRNHSTMLCRELLYTAVTRAREQLTIIANPFIIKKAIMAQRIKGNSLAEKIEYFNSGVLNDSVYLVPDNQMLQSEEAA